MTLFGRKLRKAGLDNMVRPFRSIRFTPTGRCSTSVSKRARSSARSASRRSRSTSLALASYCLRRPRRQVRTTLIRVVGWKGRSTKVTLPSSSVRRAASGVRSAPSPRRVSRMTGRSDHGGCAAIQATSPWRSAVRTASSARMSNPAPSSSAVQSAGRSGQACAAIPTSPSKADATVASRPCGARIRVRSVVTASLKPDRP